MRRPWLLSLVVVLSGPALAEDPNPVLDEARAMMREGLERELPAPSARGPAQWPSAQPGPAQPQKEEPAKKEEKKESPQQLQKDTLAERVRNEASLRARAAAEERRTAPDNNQGVGQTRTRAAKTMGPRPKPPKP